MSSSPSWSVTLHDLHLYHKIDREVFTRLVINLARDITQSLLIISIWLWLDDIGYHIISGKMRIMSDVALAALANEAVLCLRVLEAKDPVRVPSNGGFLRYSSKLLRINFTLRMIMNRKYTAISGVKTFLNHVCSRVFPDILQRLLPSSSNPNQPLTVPGFPHATFGSITILSHPLDYSFTPPKEMWAWDAGRKVQDVDRTMFLTFSRGFPVTAEEVVELFQTLFGVDSVDAVEMQPLFALLVLHSVSTVDELLAGNFIAKFKINGKHIWARKYKPRNN